MLSNRLRWIFSICIALAILLYGHHVQWELLGFEQAEVYGHAWSLDWRFSDFPNTFRGTDITVGTQDFPVIDVLPTVIVSLFRTVLSLANAYNALFVLSLVVNAWMVSNMLYWEAHKKTVGQTRETTESELAFWLIPYVLTLSTPIFWGAFNSGLTEDWGIGLTALSIGLLHRKRFVIAGVCLALTAYWGLVLGWMSAIVFVVVALVHRVSIRNISVSTLTTLIFVSPLMLLHSTRLSDQGHRSISKSVLNTDFVDPLWALNPWHRTDLASLLSSTVVEYSDHIVRLHPASLGWVALMVSLRCRDWRWWIGLVLCVLWALGPDIYWMGQHTGIQNPAHFVLSLIPGADLINHSGRWMLMGALCWVVILSKGLYSIQRSWIRFGLLGFIVLEWVFYTPLGFPLMGTSPIKESLVLQELSAQTLPENTRVLRIPVRGPGVVFQQALYEQRIHRQPLWMNPNRSNPTDWFALTPTSQWIETIARDREVPMGACVPNTVGSLLVAQPFVDLLILAFGPADQSDAHYSVWYTPSVCGEDI